MNVKQINQLIRDIISTPIFIKNKENRIKLLRTFSYYCKEINVDFWLGYGTLLGCLRHNGMIPWDDDIDICINRNDLDKLLSNELNGFEIFKQYENNDVLYGIRNIDTTIDIFCIPVDLNGDEGGYYRIDQELTKDEIYPFKIGLFEGDIYNIPNNPYEFFKRRYFGQDVMNKCSIWNHDINNLYTKEFNPELYVIDIKDLSSEFFNNPNNDYWFNFYNNNKVDNEPTPFSIFCLNYMEKNKNISDIGCGNSRDTVFFNMNELNCTGFDKVSFHNQYYKNLDIVKNIELLPISDYYYFRFFFHTLTEKECDFVLENIFNKMNSNSKIFIETRSTTDITENDKCVTNFYSGIGTKHFRMHYSLKYFSNKLKNIGFKINYEQDLNNVSVFKKDNPYVLRIIAYKPLINLVV